MASAAAWKLGDCSIEGINTNNGHVKVKDCGGVSPARVPTVYLGETISYDVVIRRSSSVVDVSYWKNTVSKISCQVLVIPIDAMCTNSSFSEEALATNASPGSTNPNNNSQFSKNTCLQSNENEISCSLLSTFTGNAFTEKDSVSEPYFADDDTFVFPMSSNLQGFKGSFKFVELQVTLSLFTLNAGKWSDSSPENEVDHSEESEENGEELDIFEEMGRKSKSNKYGDSSKKTSSEMTRNALEDGIVQESSSTIHSVVEKNIKQRIKVQCLPHLKMRVASAGPKHFLLLNVGNHTERQVVIKSMDLLLGSPSKEKECAVDFCEGPSIVWESCHHLASLEHPKKSTAFPVMLSPMEELSLVYKLWLSSVSSDLEFCFQCSMKWTHAGASREITSIFKLPIVKVRHPLFVVMGHYEEEPVLHKSFSVTYNISNHLYDFMSMKLYYNVDNMKKAISEKGSSVSEEDRLKVNRLKDAIHCQNPVIHTCSCPKGSSIPVTVNFQIFKPGLYEMNELMKVNLNYSLIDTSPEPNSSRSDSMDTVSSGVSSEEQLLSSRQLWKNRSGSSASLVNATTDEKRKKFAGKSYSFGDLGPAGSFTDVREGPSSRPRTFKRSTAVPPPRPPPPRKLSQVEQDLINPGNFLKTPFYIYIKEPSALSNC